ncbi:MAG: nickel pincer cofactor biosynthesis protein LarC [Pyrinomonadaceae bacterium MAG19_C2-C3]|nr:nickel pincer cofactor biosynthesis protein LarC [Pyrinomonadaceae bacterium MAG19_C2-C3]
MKTLYFDGFAGASGDMILGALVAAGVAPDVLIEKLKLLDVADFAVEFETTNRSGISATKAHVRIPHEHKHRHLKDIAKIINDSRLPDSIKESAIEIFTRLAEAEARVHNEPVEKIHFHEVGALDAIIDIVGACIGFELLGIERFISSPLNTGKGSVEMAHGLYPVPPPAVVELMRGAPVYANDITGELLTPTGAAIISTLCEEYGALPAMRIESAGYGAGNRDYPRFPNVLRIIIGETTDNTTEDKHAAHHHTHATSEHLTMLETNIDDASPQVIGFVMEQAFKRGALDCYFTAIQMKKNRPGTLISILCETHRSEDLRAMLFAETTTIGIRSYQVERRALEREIVTVETEFGRIDVKVSRFKRHDDAGEHITATPEYEHCRRAAERGNVPLRVVEAAARAAYLSTSNSSNSHAALEAEIYDGVPVSVLTACDTTNGAHGKKEI